MKSPPAWAVRFATTDLDEARAVFGRFGPHERRCLGKGALDFRWAFAFLGGAAIGWGASNLGQRVRATTRFPLLHIPLARPMTYRTGQRHLESAPGRAVFIGAGCDYTVAYTADCPTVGLQLNEAKLRRALRQTGYREEQLAMAGALEVPLPDGAIARLAEELHELWGPQPIDPESPLAAGLRRRLTAWVAQQLARCLGAPRSTPVAAARVTRVEEWIDAHLHEPIDLGQLCEVAGIEARGLRWSFRQRRAMSPLQWVSSRRMAAARMRILDPVPGDSVTRIAHDLGITHTGRFSVGYRHRYGESPSVTLARSLG